MLLNTRSSNHQLLLFLVQILTMAVIRDLTYSMPVRVQPALGVVAGVVALGPDLDHGGDTGPNGLPVRVQPLLLVVVGVVGLGPDLDHGGDTGPKGLPVRVQPLLVVVDVVGLGPDLDHGGDTGPYGLLVRVLPHLEQRFTAHRLGPTWNRCSSRIRTRRDNATAVKYAIIEICTHS